MKRDKVSTPFLAILSAFCSVIWIYNSVKSYTRGDSASDIATNIFCATAWIAGSIIWFVRYKVDCSTCFHI